jgi:hypothetical protein
MKKIGFLSFGRWTPFIAIANPLGGGYRHVKEVLYDSGLDHRFGWAGQEDNI